jgi:hypothetical protein
LAAFDARAADMVLSPDLLGALEANAGGTASPQQQALLFKHNDKVNRARANDWIDDRQYQAAQSDYAERSEAFARQSAEEIAGAGSFAKQSAKPGTPKIFSPGTDSDYIVRVESASQIKAMQDSYNQRIDNYLKDNGVLDRPGTKWHNKLDTDFMADPSLVDKSTFETIAKLNNDAYRRQLAADYERISRAGDGSKIGPDHIRAYGEEMQDFIAKKRAALDAARSDPNYWSNRANRADIYRKMAQEQKYIERLESLNDTWRKQNGLSVGRRDPATEPFVAETDADGHTVLRRRVPMDANGFALLEPTDAGSIAQRGSIRAPANIHDT